MIENNFIKNSKQLILNNIITIIIFYSICVMINFYVTKEYNAINRYF